MIELSDKIQELTSEVANQIAAGEVVERPASVVKELVENSLDAGASKIEVDFISGGVRKIKVSDDGQGIAVEDLSLAVKKHTTSKISSAADLESVQTLGFRGEALASIASVARIEILSCRAGSSEAAILVKEAGEEPQVKPAARSQGTTVTVENLFENVPARKKFLATTTTEKKHILKEIQKKILAHPDVHFILSQEGRELLNVPPGELRERVIATLGEETAGHLIETNSIEPDWKGKGRFALTGLISDGEAVHHSRRHQFLFVNSRPVREPVLYRAILQAYKDLVLTNQHPVVVLFLNLPRIELDVNVHPRKEEVRFNDSRTVFKFLYQTVTEALKSHYQDEASTNVEGTVSVGGSLSGGYFEQNEEKGDPDDSFSAQPTQGGLFQKEEEKKEKQARVIGQFRNLFLLVEKDSGLLFLDQHNAHERVLYEQYLERAAGEDSAQYLSVPIRLEVSRVDREILENNRDELAKLGLEIDSFGGGSMIVQAVPGFLGRRSDDRKAVFSIIEEFIETVRQGDVSRPEKEMLAIMACRNAVKRGERLLPREQEELVAGLNGLDFPKLCPHGRPLYYEVKNEEMARWVGRPLSDLDPR